MEQLWGLCKWMHKQYSRLVQVKARKRLGNDQLESDNSHEHALRLINNECLQHTSGPRGSFVLQLFLI